MARDRPDRTLASRVGAPAVDFDLPDTGGVRHSLAGHRGRWLLLVFHRHLA